MPPSESTKVYLHIKTVEKKPSLWKKLKGKLQVWRDHFKASSEALKSRFPKQERTPAIVRMPVKAKAYRRKILPGITTSLSEIFRNPLRSLATIFIIALVLSTLSLAIIVSFLTEEAIRIVNTKLDFSIEVKDNVTLDQIQPLMHELDILPYVVSVTYISKNQALENFRKEHPDLPDFLTTYEISNPLPATIRISISDPKKHPELINFIDRRENSAIIDLSKVRNNFDQRNRIEQLIVITDTIKYFLYFFITIFISIGILIIISTVQLSLNVRKRELSIMQVVGASYRKILFPFITEAIWLSIISTAIALFFLFLIAQKLTPFALEYFGTNSVNIASFIQINFLPITVILLGTAMGITGFSTTLTAWKYLRSQRLF